jgi:hypothetical protein
VWEGSTSTPVALDVKKFEELFCIIPGEDKKAGVPQIVEK